MKKIIILFFILALLLMGVYMRYKENDLNREGGFSNFLIKATKEFSNYNMTDSESEEYSKLINSSYEIMENKKFNEVKAIEDDFTLLSNKIKSENVIFIYKQTQILEQEVQEIQKNPQIEKKIEKIKLLVNREKYLKADEKLNELNIDILKEREKEKSGSVNKELIKINELISKRDLKKAQNVMNFVNYTMLDSFNKEEYRYLEEILKEKFTGNQQDITQ